MSVEATVLARIRPSAEEEARLTAAVKEILGRIGSILKEEGWEAKPFLAGSVAKGTHLTEPEVDVFVAFPPELPRTDLETRGLAVGAFLERRVHQYAEHPYTHGYYRGIEVEIVPCYRITDASQRMSAVDRTPFHVDFVLGHLKDGQADEIRLLKAWAEGIGVYGAEAKIRGFSGYLCELLVLKYGTFRGVLEASLAWRPGVVLDLDRPASKTFEEPLVVVDPVDPNRNVASAVSLEQMATFVHAAREYVHAPSDRYFFPRPLKPTRVPKLRTLMNRRGVDLLAITARAPDVTDDVLYPQVRKAHRAFLDLFRRNDFTVLDSRFDVSGNQALFLFEFEVAQLPRVERHTGPPLWVKNSKDFLDKWRRNKRALGAPFLVDDRWTVDVLRDGTTAAALVKFSWRQMGLGKDLDKSARKSFRVHAGAAALRPAFAEAWTKLFDKRFPWQR